MDRQLYVTGIFFDHTEVYDVMNHDVLPDQLTHYCIREVTNLWFKSYFSHQTQLVEIVQIDEKNFS